MQRYFFHMASTNDVVKDDKGRELESLRAAHGHALLLIRKAAKFLLPDDIKGWRLEVADSNGKIKLVVLVPGRFIQWSKRADVAPPIRGARRPAGEQATPLLDRAIRRPAGHPKD